MAELSPYAKSRGFTSSPGTWGRVKEVGAMRANALVDYVSELWDTADALAHGEGATEQEMLDLAFGIGGVGAGYGAGKAAVSPRGGHNPNAASMFVPAEMAKPTEKLLLDRAKELADSGAPMEDIWRRTGWYNTPADRVWKTEVPDNRASLYSGDGSLPEVLGHPELYGRPGKDLFDYIDVEADPYYAYHPVMNEYGPLGTWSPGEMKITYSSMPPHGSGTPLDSVLHEVQHAIQGRYGMQPGSSPERFTSGVNVLEDMLASAAHNAKKRGQKFEDLSPGEQVVAAYLDKLVGTEANKRVTVGKLYERAIGEMEAEDVTKRRKLGFQERRHTIPDALKYSGLRSTETGPADILRYIGRSNPRLLPALEDAQKTGLIDRFFFDSYLSDLF